jgi:hypothetical protein
MRAQADWAQAQTNLYKEHFLVLFAQLSLQALQGPIDTTTLQTLDDQFKLK